MEGVDLLVTPSTGSAIIQPETQSDVEGVCRVGILESCRAYSDWWIDGTVALNRSFFVRIKNYENFIMRLS